MEILRKLQYFIDNYEELNNCLILTMTNDNIENTYGQGAKIKNINFSKLTENKLCMWNYSLECIVDKNDNLIEIKNLLYYDLIDDNNTHKMSTEQIKNLNKIGTLIKLMK